MQTKNQIGATKFYTGKLALGCVTFGREIDEETSFRIMDYALEKGITLFDTAEAYGDEGASEKVIGRWLKRSGCRDQVVLQTKVSFDFAAAAVARAIEASLNRLQTDTVDFYLTHSFNEKTPLEETLGAIGDGMRSGKIAATGCSNYNVEQLRLAIDLSNRLGLPRLEMTQPPYNLVSREIEGEYLAFCAAEGIGVVPYSPLGAGFLSGKYAAGQEFPKGSRFDVKPGHAAIYFSDQNFQTVENLRALSERTGIPMVKLALGWVLRNPEVTSVLVGARTTAHIDNALAALNMPFDDAWASELTA
ncbi:MAG: aldo/keto reductase [Bryobacteraceae bacterium]